MTAEKSVTWRNFTNNLKMVENKREVMMTFLLHETLNLWVKKLPKNTQSKSSHQISSFYNQQAIEAWSYRSWFYFDKVLRKKGLFNLMSNQ